MDLSVRTFERAACAVFFKVKEEHGGCSNMAGGFPLRVNDVVVPSSEALYQACRYPDNPALQAVIVAQKSPMSAKMKAKPHRAATRPDWAAVQVPVMRWCLRVKLCQNWERFGAVLRATGGRRIVEQSRKDPFWGAKVDGDDRLVGANVLGQLLDELCAEYLAADVPFAAVAPLDIPDFRLLGRPIGPVLAT